MLRLWVQNNRTIILINPIPHYAIDLNYSEIKFNLYKKENVDQWGNEGKGSIKRSENSAWPGSQLWWQLALSW